MTHNRYVPKRPAEPQSVPFESAEAAWLWYCQNQIARIEGARFSSTETAAAPRPCDPDDVFTLVDRLYKANLLSRRHLVVLGDYGVRLAPPLVVDAGARAAQHCWNEAMALMTPALKIKGIIA